MYKIYFPSNKTYLKSLKGLGTTLAFKVTKDIKKAPSFEEDEVLVHIKELLKLIEKGFRFEIIKI